MSAWQVARRPHASAVRGSIQNDASGAAFSWSHASASATSSGSVERQVTLDVLQGGLEAVQAALEILDELSRHDDVVVAQPVGGGQLAGQVRLLATAVATEPAGSTGTGCRGERAATPPTPPRLIARGVPLPRGRSCPVLRHVTKLPTTAGAGVDRCLDEAPVRVVSR
jgi:hypothetical protein